MGCKKQEVQEVLTLHVHGFISGTPIGNKPIVEWKGKALILNKLKFHDKKSKSSCCVGPWGPKKQDNKVVYLVVVDWLKNMWLCGTYMLISALSSNCCVDSCGGRSRFLTWNLHFTSLYPLILITNKCFCNHGIHHSIPYNPFSGTKKKRFFFLYNV